MVLSYYEVFVFSLGMSSSEITFQFPIPHRSMPAVIEVMCCVLGSDAN